jgi:XTP/dITP diphosphohydrolase
MDLLLATTNPGKIREIRLALEGLDLRLLAVTEVAPGLDAPEETGTTFDANAALKARFYAENTGLATVAEDSGLSIDAIGGRPGVESARYPGATYPEKFTRLYAELAAFARPWTAHYTSAIALIDGTGVLAYSAEATVEGEIAPAPRGAHGFGYDPIFFFPPYGCTTGEMTDEQKLGISHRGRAFRAFRQWLEAKHALQIGRSGH